jgi:hypothetical protein
LRKHSIIREVTVGPSSSFRYDFETSMYDNLLITWANAADSVGPPTSIALSPTAERHDGDVLSNLPGVPVVPALGAVAYVGVGPNCTIAIPLPTRMTVGVTTPVGVTVTVRVEGDEHEDLFKDPRPSDRNLS